MRAMAERQRAMAEAEASGLGPIWSSLASRSTER